ncbi:hypothetical protein GCM10028778_11850 [Barrientosiimonas marina]|uniref:HNH endonuclease n=1 Tax=Lentibacillus kimchii TaxID=1542911 RepID=A0ABW2UYJ5_9BACI
MVESNKECIVEWCNNSRHNSGNGYYNKRCRRHYDQYRKYGYNFRTDNDPNEIVEHEEYSELIIRQGIEIVETVKVDKEDVPMISRYKWLLHDKGYILTKINQTTKYLHRMIMNPPGYMEVDHINLDKTDNRKSNMRVCTHIQNTWNRQGNGVAKITDRPLSKPYVARITIDGKHIHLGYYKTFEEARQHRVEAEHKYHGEYRYIYSEI